MRFSSVLDSKDALLAAATLPRFKIRWIKDEERRNHVKSLLTAECQAQHSDGHIVNPVEQKPSNSNDNDFFVFEDEDVCYSSETQVMEYLKSSGLELDILNKFPNIKVISLKYNTATPSSAPVERLFSLGSLVLTPKRNRLSSKRFEKLLLMRYNRYFTDK